MSTGNEQKTNDSLDFWQNGGLLKKTIFLANLHFKWAKKSKLLLKILVIIWQI